MRVAVFDTHEFDRGALEAANGNQHELHFLEVRLDDRTATLAQGCDAVCLFANDRADRKALEALHRCGIKLIALRSAGYNHVDVASATELGMTVVRVPEYSPYAVAEHAVALLLTLVRKTHKAHNRVHEMNFSIDGLMGFDLHGKTVGVVGTGRIGKAFSQIMRGFGCRVIALEKCPDPVWANANSISYVNLETLLRESDVISLHVPLSDSTRHLIDESSIQKMKKDVVLLNTGRGALIDSKALIQALKSRTIGAAGLDVYEEEAGIFFSDLSVAGINDDLLARLLTFPNVLVTAHQGFLTREALRNIAMTTIDNISRFERHEDLKAVRVTL